MCVAADGRLASLSSALINAEVSAILKAHPGGGAMAWIGGSYDGSSWRWESGGGAFPEVETGDVLPYANWDSSSGEPKAAGCAAIDPTNGAGKWYSELCMRRLRYAICQEVAPPPGPPPSSPPPPPSTTAATVSIGFSLSGEVSSYDTDKVSILQQTLATAAAVPTYDVAIEIQAASVRVAAIIILPDAATATSTSSILSSGILASASTLESALGSAGLTVTVESDPTVTTDVSKGGVSTGVFVGGVIGAAFGAACIGCVVGRLLMRSRRKTNRPSKHMANHSTGMMDIVIRTSAQDQDRNPSWASLVASGGVQIHRLEHQISAAEYIQAHARRLAVMSYLESARMAALSIQSAARGHSARMLYALGVRPLPGYGDFAVETRSVFAPSSFNGRSSGSPAVLPPAVSPRLAAASTAEGSPESQLKLLKASEAGLRAELAALRAAQAARSGPSWPTQDWEVQPSRAPSRSRSNRNKSPGIARTPAPRPPAESPTADQHPEAPSPRMYIS